MATTYKTPGVYVEEISKFPPSVAQVATAIPAFVGYTQMAKKNTDGDLKNKAFEITSLLEYEMHYGAGAPININSVKLDENNAVKESDLNAQFYMYDSLRMFFNNGGGKCYIVSIGSYNEAVADTNFTTGIDVLKKVDEPTLLLFPDAPLLDDDIYGVQTHALQQCADLQDRFCILDLLESKSSDSNFDWDAGVDEFRQNIGINNLKYGAAYTPWLETNLPINIRFRDVQSKLVRGGNPVGLAALTDSAEIIGILNNLGDVVGDVDTVQSDIDSLRGASTNLKARYATLADTFRDTNTVTNYKALYTFIYDIIDDVDSWAGATPLNQADALAAVQTIITDSLLPTMTTMVQYDMGADTSMASSFKLYNAALDPAEAAEWGTIFADPNGLVADTSIFTGTDDAARRLNSLNAISTVFEQVNAAITEIQKTLATAENTFETSLYNTHTVYKSIIDTLEDSMTELPPSGAMAGIYARTDRTRGVWKAPANTSVNNALGVTNLIDKDEQEDLNVDVVAGKSINAIRPFTGKGILVWGARTLAGNDNEWRYVPVRRFFIMAEESIEKAIEPFVFEPNDANTWVRVRSMIENFLILQWRAGALAGAKPDQAFYVRVGLGETMTADDILNGIMNVEIGMAVVRPAEFIVLKFSHKMQES